MTDQPQLTDEQIAAHLERIQARAGKLTGDGKPWQWDISLERNAAVALMARHLHVLVQGAITSPPYQNRVAWRNQNDADAIADVPITEAVALALSRLTDIQSGLNGIAANEIARLRDEAVVKDQTIKALQAHIEDLKKIAAAYATGKVEKRP